MRSALEAAVDYVDRTQRLGTRSRKPPMPEVAIVQLRELLQHLNWLAGQHTDPFCWIFKLPFVADPYVHDVQHDRVLLSLVHETDVVWAMRREEPPRSQQLDGVLTWKPRPESRCEPDDQIELARCSLLRRQALPQAFISIQIGRAHV